MDTKIRLFVPMNQKYEEYKGRYWETIKEYRSMVSVTINGQLCRATISEGPERHSLYQTDKDRYEEYVLRRLQTEIARFLTQEIFKGAVIERHE